MSGPARAMSKDEAFAELQASQEAGLILLEPGATAHRVSLDGWNPATGAKEDGTVAGVVVKYLPSGTVTSFNPSGGVAPDRLDPRNALALVRLGGWLAETYGVFELYHLGISGDAEGIPNQRTDCHGQGRAVDLVGVQAAASDGTTYFMTVQDDWGTVATAVTPGGSWPQGTGSAVDWASKSQLPGYPLRTADRWPGLTGPSDAGWTNAAPAPRQGTASPTAADFAARYRGFAEQSQAVTGVPALVTLGQAALESDWGRAAPGNNFFASRCRSSPTTTPEPPGRRPRAQR